MNHPVDIQLTDFMRAFASRDAVQVGHYFVFGVALASLAALLPGALPVRGGYLTEGDALSTPLTVYQVVTEHSVIRARAGVEELTLVTLDLATGQFSTQSRGHVAAGEDVVVDTDGDADDKGDPAETLPGVAVAVRAK